MALISRSLRGTASQVSASLVALVLLLLPLASCGGPSPTIVPTATPASLKFTPFDLRLPAAALNAPVVGTLPADTVMQITISFKLHQAVLDQLKQQKVKAGQQRDLRFLANQLGISDATYHKIQQTLGISGVSMRLSSLHTSLNVEAKAALVAAAFQTQFVLHTLDGRTFYAPATTPKVPTFLAPLILAITGLDNFSPPVTPRHSSLGQHLNTLPARLPAGGSCPPFPALSVNPGAIAHAYGYDQLWNHGWHGEGMTVNLVEIDGINQSDVQHYFQCVNSPGNLKVVDVGTPPTLPTNFTESTLDIEMLAGLAPAVNIVDYETNYNKNTVLMDIETELQRIIDDNAEDSAPGSIVSVSLGSPESRAGILQSPNDISAIDQEFQILTQVEHMTVFVASGDCGAFESGINGDLSVNAFAASPDVVAVGGTELTVDGSHQRSGEVAWFLGSNVGHCASTGTAPFGSGGGRSRTIPQPAWQTGAGVSNQYSNGHRQLPDVSAVAWDLTTYYQGNWAMGYGVGTSAATPIWAAGFSLVEQGLIQSTGNYVYGPDIFYAVANQSNGATPYYDVTQDAPGTTPYFPATPGWDYATGLGTPNLADFYATTVALVGAEGEGEGNS